MSERNIKIILEYDGGRYDGWQRQGNTDRTIQGKLENILEKMTGCSVEIHGSGRTDAGVHAKGQTANFRLPAGAGSWTEEEIMDYMNRYLPDDIAVLSAAEVPLKFHSRLNASSKIYRYRIETAKKASVFDRRYLYVLGKKLDVAKMEQAASFLTGTHDFKAFSSVKRTKKSTIRTIESISIEKRGTIVEIVFTGNGFLYNMVRIISGTLIEAGTGDREPDSVCEVLRSGKRELAGFTAPPEGLILEKVLYN